jgi:hypothetical protein
MARRAGVFHFSRIVFSFSILFVVTFPCIWTAPLRCNGFHETNGQLSMYGPAFTELHPIRASYPQRTSDGTVKDRPSPTTMERVAWGNCDHRQQVDSRSFSDNRFCCDCARSSHQATATQGNPSSLPCTGYTEESIRHFPASYPPSHLPYLLSTTACPADNSSCMMSRT